MHLPYSYPYIKDYKDIPNADAYSFDYNDTPTRLHCNHAHT